VKDTAGDVIPRSMQRLAGRTAQNLMLKNSDSGCPKRSQMEGGQIVIRVRGSCWDDEHEHFREHVLCGEPASTAVTEGMFTRRKPEGSYSDVFAVENEAPRLDTGVFGTQAATEQLHSLGAPMTPDIRAIN
jgi:hypothetical protein